MATIAGILLNGSGALSRNTYIRVRPSSPPFDGVGVIRSAMPELFVTHASTAAYSFTLAQGGYLVNIPATPEFSISVPAGSGTYTLEAIAGEFIPTTPGEYPLFDTIGEAEAAIILGNRVDIVADSNGRAGCFLKDNDYAGALDGVNGFEDAVGTKFKRIQFE